MAYADLTAPALLTFSSDFSNLSKTGQWRPNKVWSEPDGKNQDTTDLASYYVDPNYAPLASANPFVVTNGVLDIQVKRPPADLDTGLINGKPYVSGLLQTGYTFNQLYGYFEVRAALPVGNGIGAAFWMLTADGSQRPEIDILESTGDNLTRAYQTLLTDGQSENQYQITASVPVTPASAYHTYGLNWQPDFITFYIDGKETGRFTTPEDLHKSMYLLLENDASGDDPGLGVPTDDTTPLPAHFLVDYVHAFAAMPETVGLGGTPPKLTFLPMPADPLVDPVFYNKQLGANVIPTAATQQQAATSYDALGWEKGLNPDAFFNTNYYLSKNPDVLAAHVNPLLHFETVGWKQGRDPSAEFSTTKYLAAYSDVKASGVEPLLHYLLNGQAEGRTAFHV